MSCFEPRLNEDNSMLSSVPNVQPTEPMYSAPVETLDLSDATQPPHGARLPRISLSCHQGRKEWHVFDCAKHLELKPKVNRFIRQQYFLAHGANLGDLMANLYALEEQDGTLLGAVGPRWFWRAPALSRMLLETVCGGVLKQTPRFFGIARASYGSGKSCRH